jgi:hypothetical protein
MKLCIAIPTENYRIKHIKTMINGGIRLSKKHDTEVVLMSSEKLDMTLPEKYKCIQYGKITPFHRLKEFLFSKNALKYDVIFSCDDDSLNYAKGMHKYFEDKTSSYPTYWGGSPGHIHNHNAAPYGPILYNCIINIKKDYNLNKNYYCGWESGALNKAAILRMHKNSWSKKVLECFATSAREPDGKPLWASELVMRSAAVILDMKTERIGNEATMMPVFLESSVLTKKGNINVWHCHFTHDHHSLTHEALNHALKNGPFNDISKCVSTLFPFLKVGFKSSKFINKKLYLGYFFNPYVNMGRRIPAPYKVKNLDHIVLLKDNKTNKGTEWKPIKNGFEIITRDYMVERYMWCHDNILVGIRMIKDKVTSEMPCLFWSLI